MPGSTANEASVLNDQDGAGGDPPMTTGPVSADVEIVEVLALPPLGDGSSSGASATTMLLAALAALALVVGGRKLTPDPPNPRPDSAAGTRKQVPL